MQDGVTPLYMACQEGHVDIVEILIQAGADIHEAITEVFNSKGEFLMKHGTHCSGSQ